MEIVLPLDKMTVEEKLKLMEVIWADLSRNPDDIPVPQWHLDILREREQLVQEGKAHYIDWASAKKQIDEEIARGRPMTVEILEAAKRDLLDCYWFYEMQAPGVGVYFLKHLKTEIDSLANYAGIHRRLHGRYYCMVSRKFPHIIYYHVQDQTAFVDAVIDGRRSPEWIKQRLK